MRYSTLSSHSLATDEQRWQAVLARDARADGQFVTAVRSTGIFCRPSCPAKHPKRENVSFFATPREAEDAGYRPCRRCRPTDAHAQAEHIRRLCRYIESHLDAPLTLAELSAHANLSPYHLQRVFKRLTGISPRQYAEACRTERLRAQLKNGSTVADAAYDAGFNSSSRLYEHPRLGATPAVYRRGGAGMRIGYAIADSPLGRLLVAATDRGICFISLADSDSTLEAALRGDYHAADIYRDDERLKDWVRAVVSHLEGSQPSLDLPLDIRGTAFQLQVWKALQSIPYGRTQTYGQIAKRIGRPSAARAVGHACGSNPVPPLIPCHRAVGSSGSLTGYRWGVERKRALLEREKK